VEFVADTAALGRFSPSTSVSFANYSTDCSTHHPSFKAGTIGQIVADVPSAFGLIWSNQHTALFYSFGLRD
jgi:hypothetical protein